MKKHSRDMALQAIAYGNVYVARIAFGANQQQALQAMREQKPNRSMSIVNMKAAIRR